MSILDPSYMIDLGGIDVIQSQGVAIPGLYHKLLDNIGPCGNPLIYNWKFNGVFIPPQFVEPILEDDAIYINDIYVSSDDVVHIPTIEIQPTIVQLAVSENGDYEAPEGVDGYNPVSVDVQPTIVQLNVLENGTYEVPEDVDGFNPVVVNVPGAAHDLFDGLFEQGSFRENGLNDAPTSETHNQRVRSINYIPVTAGETYLIIVNQIGTYTPQISVSYYTANDYTTPRISYTDWLAKISLVKPPANTAYIRFLVRKSTNGNITPSEVDSAHFYSVSEIEGQ